MKLLSERLEWAKTEKEKRDGRTYSWAALGRECGVSPAAVSLWKNDENGIEGQYARPLALFLGVDPLWLETGSGAPYPSNDSNYSTNTIQSEIAYTEQLTKLITLFSQSTEEGRNFILQSAGVAEKAVGVVRNKTTA